MQRFLATASALLALICAPSCASPAFAQPTTVSALPADSSPTTNDNLYVEQGNGSGGAGCPGTPTSTPACNGLHLSLSELKTWLGGYFGAGTVTSVSASGPLGGGTVTTSGTVGLGALTAHGLLLGEGSSSIAAATPCAAGAALIGAGSSADPACGLLLPAYGGLPGNCPPIGRYFANYQPGLSPPGYNGTASVENTVYASPIVITCDMTINTLSVAVEGTAGASGAVVRIGLYADDGSGEPGALLEDCGTATATATYTASTVTCGSAIVLTPRIVWCAAVTQGQSGAQPALGANLGDSIVPASFANLTDGSISYGATGWAQTGVTAALPSTWAGSTNSSGEPAAIAPRCILHRSA